MIQIDLKHCTCCGACVQACPKQCITRREHENGFLYPVVNSESCIRCGRCEAVCPINKSARETAPKASAAVSRKKKQLEKASSGGAFGAIADYILAQGGIVYGCAFTDHLRAVHIRISSARQLPVLFGSKYVQSNTANTFVQVKQDLKSGKTVLYSGTPCQIAGLRHFLGRDEERLILVDIICHGVPSQAYFDKYIRWIESEQKGSVVDYQFRSKRNHGWSLAGEYTLVDEKGEKKRKKLFYFDHYYYYYFLESSIYRECCYHCKYTNLSREGDFTLGDLWGAERFSNPFDTSRGCSLVLVNTPKASEIMQHLELDTAEIELGTAARYNEQLVRPSKRHPEREKRIVDYICWSAQEIQADFLKRYRVARIKGKVKYMVPTPLIKYINWIRYRVRR